MKLNLFFKCDTLEEFVRYLQELPPGSVRESQKHRHSYGSHRVIGINAIGGKRYAYNQSIRRHNSFYTVEKAAA